MEIDLLPDELNSVQRFKLENRREVTWLRVEKISLELVGNQYKWTRGKDNFIPLDIDKVIFQGRRWKHWHCFNSVVYIL